MESQHEVEDNSSVTEPEYEWGIKYFNPFGETLKEWGYAKDPRLTVIDSTGKVEIDGYYRSVIAVGKRLDTAENWEEI